MPIICHSSRPFLSLLAGYSLSGYLPDAARAAALGARNDWRSKPLYIAVRSAGGRDFVACLAQGRHRDLYQRALQGTASLFGHDIFWLDVDEIRRRQKRTHFTGYLAVTLASMYPGLLANWLKGPLNAFAALITDRQQEGKN
jgi:hypothetical protein